VTVEIEPGTSCVEMRSETSNEVEISGPRQVGAGEQQKEWRRVDTAVVAAERHFAQRRHLSAWSLVQDLPGLGVGRCVLFRRLIDCKAVEHASCDGRIEPEHLPGRDKGVTAKNSAEP